MVKELLTSQNPDISVLCRGKSCSNDDPATREIFSESWQFLQTFGTPPWDRLGLKPLGKTILINSKMLIVGKPLGVDLIYGTLNRPNIEKENFNLMNLAWNSPLRRVDFPYKHRILSLILTDLEAEKVFRRKFKTAFFQGGKFLETPVVKADRLRLMFRSNTWKNPTTGEPCWGVLNPGGLTHKKVSLECVQTIINLGESYFTNLLHES